MALKVGFIGLGTMGTGMARNLARAGFALALTSRTAAKVKTLSAELGAKA
ncbi:MAG TPA: NAD(P)-binding domain-containing protein, partial [Thermoanaerobaculia bacterium]|nr:NAD(P)-binding domain-containing protein [Thermoanaerobaculia bacterium]